MLDSFGKTSDPAASYCLLCGFQPLSIPSKGLDASSADLDPQDWDAFAREAHEALDLMIEHLRSLREQKVWQPIPDEIKARFETPLPREGRAFSDLLDDFAHSILPYGAGNVHPLFLGWVQGAGTPIGMVAEMLAAGLNANCGGRNHIAIDVERQITLWLAELFGFPLEASGVFVTGTSLANLLAVLVARRDALGDEVRREGLHDNRRLTGYTSQEAHGCIAKAFDLAGLGSDSLRMLPVDADGGISLKALREAVARDRAAGLMPAIVVGTAGTVNTGAFDSLDSLADFCEAENLWFHIDGAFGALCALSPELKHLVTGIERANSIALDFHKWLQVPYDAGFLLVRDAEAHRQTFMSSGAYLSRAPRGLAAGDIWPCDLGPDLSRGFRALKTWFTVQAFGTERLGAMIAETCRVARHLGSLVEASSQFELSRARAPQHRLFQRQGRREGERRAQSRDRDGFTRARARGAFDYAPRRQARYPRGHPQSSHALKRHGLFPLRRDRGRCADGRRKDPRRKARRGAGRRRLTRS